MRVSAVVEQGESLRKRVGDKVDGLIDIEVLEKDLGKLKLVEAWMYGKELNALLDTGGNLERGASSLTGRARREAHSQLLPYHGRRQQDGHS